MQPLRRGDSGSAVAEVRRMLATIGVLDNTDPVAAVRFDEATESAVKHFQEGGYEPANLAAFASRTNGFEGIIEHVVQLPEAGLDLTDLGSPPAPPAVPASGG